MHAKSLQLCSTLCNPVNWSPPGSSIHGILQARILEWFAISFSEYIHRRHKKKPNGTLFQDSLSKCLSKTLPMVIGEIF